MTLSPGDKLGTYEMLAPLGAGGMGEVYRARDCKLDREVAIKVLPAAMANDPDRLARFKREAKVLAALSHPNIAQIYGLEENGETRALVMELVPGATLPVPQPLEAALSCARQIAGALEAAHEKGIIHRDLKPANIMLTPAGLVKVLDFGLATVPQSFAAASDSGVTVSMAATQAGMIMGTAAYMSPEQAAGKTVDKRADIWGFGVVLYELLTGVPLFAGETVSHTLAAVLHAPIDLAALPKHTPRAICGLLRRCLDRDVHRRLRDIGEARIAIEDALAHPEADEPSPAAAGRHRDARPVAVAAVSLAAFAALAFVHFRERPPVVEPVRFQIPLPAGVSISPVLSPDGTMLAFLGRSGGSLVAEVRSMDSLENKLLAGTEGAVALIWSPDSQWLAFLAGGKLKKIARTGGPATLICDAPSATSAAWGAAGAILLSAGGTISQVSAEGGIPKTLNAYRGSRLSFLPDGNHFLYADNGVNLGSLDGTPAVRLLPDAGSAIYAPPGTSGAGYLLFGRDSTLMAEPFDSVALKPTGQAVPLAGGLGNNSSGFTVSNNNSLAYLPSQAVNRALVWMDRGGNVLSTVGKPAAYGVFSLSPDQKSIVVETYTGVGKNWDIWREDLPQAVLSRFIFRTGFNRRPVWSRDGSRVAYAVDSDLYVKPAAGNGAEELILKDAGQPYDWSPDNQWIVCGRGIAFSAAGLWLAPVTKGREPVAYEISPAFKRPARFSPDGKWMAYGSDESGQDRVYIQSVPPSGAKYQVSAGGGADPQWRADGKELYFVSPDLKLMAVPLKIGATVEFGAAQPLFTVPARAHWNVNYVAVYAPARDGQKFLVNAPAAGENNSTDSPLTIVLNWQAVLNK